MKEILESTKLQFDKSDFIVDLVKHDTGSLYIEIVQRIYASTINDRSIKINPAIVDDLIQVLQKYQSKLPGQKKQPSQPCPKVTVGRIQTYYFKGVSIKDLSMIFERPEVMIEAILRSAGVQIVSNTPPAFKRFRRSRR